MPRYPLPFFHSLTELSEAKKTVPSDQDHGESVHGIDCSEGNHTIGKRAKQFTSSQCFGTTIQYREVDKDYWGRTVATVYLEDGRELNLEILKAGYAWHFKRYSKRLDYADAEDEARRAGIGLWADPNATPPWEWRRERRKSKKEKSGSSLLVQHIRQRR